MARKEQEKLQTLFELHGCVMNKASLPLTSRQHYKSWNISYLFAEIISANLYFNQSRCRLASGPANKFVK